MKSFHRFFALLLFSGFTTLAAADEGYVSHRAKVFAVSPVNVIDGSGTNVRRNQTVVVEQGRFKHIGDASSIQLPANIEVIDGRDKTLIPGFVMMHEHLFYPVGRRNYTEMLYTFPRLYLAGGATTIRTAGTMAPYADLNLRDAIRDNKAVGPDIDVTAPYLNGPGLPIYKVKAFSSVLDANKTVTYWAEQGVTSYKAYMHIRRNELAEVLRLAHERQQKVTAHLCSVTFREAAELGIDNLEHGFFVATDFVASKQPDVCPSSAEVRESLLAVDLEGEAFQSLVTLLVEKNVAITSTLTIFETYAKGRPKAPERALAMLTPEVRAIYESNWQRIAQSDNTDWQRLYLKAAAMEKYFVERGGTLLVGTDPTGYGGVIAGFANQRALVLLVENGFSVEQAIAMATLSGARFLGKDQEIGSVTEGKRADFVLLDGDLAGNIDAIHQMRRVYKAGVGYDTGKLIESARGKVGYY